ncbi:MAG: UDP-N-acetylmuramoyl-L-alanine--D-glutamate ligase [Candidatus Cloacimonetes bacterium]|nr:UDP-N-acetylmuramoyl-L-alanine--D-glutamate ligase [Candidatus Cloacimonadota bacterium]
MNLNGRRVTILGMARSGMAAANLLRRLGVVVFLSEARARGDIAEAAQIAAQWDCEFGGHTARALDADLLVSSPGVPRNARILQQAQAAGVEIISEIELGWRALHPSTQLVAITGSNGKSTTTALTAHLLRTCGLKAEEAGNIGRAMCSLPLETGALDVIVVEVSSFQLEWVERFQPHVGIVLNITPDHLNRYDSFDDYAATKLRLFAAQCEGDFAILPRDDSVVNRLVGNLDATVRTFAANDPANAHIEADTLCLPATDWSFPLDGLPLRGPHNRLNMLAALLAVQTLAPRFPGITAKQVLTGLRSFAPLEHRLEPVAELNGVLYVNDSKATNSDSVRFALQSFDQPLRLIMGGSDKGEDFAPLLPLLRQRVASLYLLGETAPALVKAFGQTVPYTVVGSLEEAVRLAASDAVPGDVALLSPACASYDMFDNFEQRGKAFKQAVLALRGDPDA